MAYVPGCSYDVFVSYAHRNNQDGALDDQHGWVTRFQDHLKRILEERCPGAQIFFDDSSLAGNDDLDERLFTAVENSATLVVVLSAVYLSRPYCDQEREVFCRHLGGEKLATPRVFLVQYDDVPFDERPTLLQRAKGYTFFHRDPVNPRLRRPLEDTSEKLREGYKDRIYELCGDLENKLKDLGKSSRPTAAIAPTPASASAAASVSAGCVVYLAEATPDLRGKKERRAVESALRSAGFRVLPEVNYDRRPAAYQQALDEDLLQATLFVQILGEAGTERSPELPQGYEGLQFARAKAAGKPCLRWRPQNLDLETIRELTPDYYRYLTDEIPQADQLLPDERVQAGFLEDFQHTIEETARKLLARPSKIGARRLGDSCVVLLSPQQIDTALAATFDRQLKRATPEPVESEIADEAYPLLDVYEDEAGLIVFYGQSPYDWVKQRVKECREIALNRAGRPPVCAIYIGPPDPKPPLPKRPTNFHVIHHDDDAALAKYLSEVSEKGVAP